MESQFAVYGNNQLSIIGEMKPLNFNEEKISVSNANEDGQTERPYSCLCGMCDGVDALVALHKETPVTSEQVAGSESRTHAITEQRKVKTVEGRHTTTRRVSSGFVHRTVTRCHDIMLCLISLGEGTLHLSETK